MKKIFSLFCLFCFALSLTAQVYTNFVQTSCSVTDTRVNILALRSAGTLLASCQYCHTTTFAGGGVICQTASDVNKLSDNAIFYPTCNVNEAWNIKYSIVANQITYLLDSRGNQFLGGNTIAIAAAQGLFCNANITNSTLDNVANITRTGTLVLDRTTLGRGSIIQVDATSSITLRQSEIDYIVVASTGSTLTCQSCKVLNRSQLSLQNNALVTITDYTISENSYHYIINTNGNSATINNCSFSGGVYLYWLNSAPSWSRIDGSSYFYSYLTGSRESASQNQYGTYYQYHSGIDNTSQFNYSGGNSYGREYVYNQTGLVWQMNSATENAYYQINAGTNGRWYYNKIMASCRVTAAIMNNTVQSCMCAGNYTRAQPNSSRTNLSYIYGTGIF